MASTRAAVIGSTIVLAVFASVVIGLGTGESINNDMPRKSSATTPTTLQPSVTTTTPTGTKAEPEVTPSTTTPVIPPITFPWDIDDPVPSRTIP